MITLMIFLVWLGVHSGVDTKEVLKKNMLSYALLKVKHSSSPLSYSPFLAKYVRMGLQDGSGEVINEGQSVIT